MILQAFESRRYLIVATLFVAVYGLILLYFDQFLFFSPYFVLYVPAELLDILLLNLALSVLTGVVFTVSIHQFRLGSDRPNRSARTGAIGIALAVVGGACPCYYMVPLLTIAGGLGGALGAAGMVFNMYELPVKMASVLMLVFVCYGLESSLRKVCNAPLSK